MLKLITKTIATVAIVSVALFGSAFADGHAKTLKIETHTLLLVHQMVKLQLNSLKT